MKKINYRLNILLIAAGVLIVSLFTLQYTSKKTNVSQPFKTIKTENIQEVIIENGSKTITAQKKNNSWIVTIDNYQYPADSEQIKSLVEYFVSFTQSEIVSTNKSKQAELGIGSVSVTFKSTTGSYIIFIGSTAGMNRNYVRIGNESNVYIAQGFDTVNTSDLRDLNPHLVNDETKINEIKLNSSENPPLTLKKNNNEWFINTTPVKKERVDFFLNDLKTLRATNIQPQAEIQLLNPELAITIQGKKAEFYLSQDDSYILTVSGANYTYDIPLAYVSTLNKTEEDFTD